MMFKIKTKAVGRVAVAAALSMGMAASLVSVASASPRTTHASHHQSVNAKTITVHGVVTVLSGTPASSVTVLNAKGISTTFAIATTTKILGGSTSTTVATLALGNRVEVRALASAPTIATKINILAAKAQRTIAVHGVVTVLSGTPASSVTVLNAKGVSTTFAIATTTKILGGSSSTTVATLAIGNRVEVRALASAPTIATKINILAAKATK